jgi:hypothetical protein
MNENHICNAVRCARLMQSSFITVYLDVVKGTENVDLGVREHNPRLCRVFDRVLCLAWCEE